MNRIIFSERSLCASVSIGLFHFHVLSEARDVSKLPCIVSYFYFLVTPFH